MKKKSGINRLQNTRNEYQGKSLKVLCVCSAGLLRSPTLAEELVKEFNYNTRACGSSQEYALIPIDDALIFWADEIVFINYENYQEAINNWPEEIKKAIEVSKVSVLNIEDNYQFRDDSLKKQLIEKFKNRIKMTQP